MARLRVWCVFLGLAASGFLAACVETSVPDEGGRVVAPGAAARVRPGAEVEAPDVFQANESALWDGRPSLGGIWVASPDAKDPERVVMFNPATGKSVKGALFRRERDNPGPRLQLSSDAAEALGVLAGAPTEIEVTALRKLEVEEPAVPETQAAAPEPDASAAEAATPSEEGKDAEEVAAAALDAVAAGAVVEEPAKPMTWKEKRAAAKAEREAKKAAEAAAKAAAAGETAAEGEAPVTPGAVAGGAIEAAPLDAGATETTKDKGGKAKPAAAVEAVEAVEPAPAATGGAARAIQIGSFSKEENAKRATEALSKIDIVAEVKKVEKDGKIYWAVVAHGDAALLQKIKDAGFADAYFLK